MYGSFEMSNENRKSMQGMIWSFQLKTIELTEEQEQMDTIILKINC